MCHVIQIEYTTNVWNFKKEKQECYYNYYNCFYTYFIQNWKKLYVIIS